MNGLVRYDGYEMKVFAPSPTDSTSFGGRTVLALHEDEAGNIWIGTFCSGLWKYDAALGNVPRPLPWTGTTGPTRVGPGQRHHPGRRGPDLGRHEYGLASIDIATGDIVWHDHLTADLRSDGGSSPHPVMADAQGHESGAAPKTTACLILDSGNRACPLAAATIPTAARACPAPSAYDIVQTPDGKIWIATTDGLALWQEATGEFIVHRPAARIRPPGPECHGAASCRRPGPAVDGIGGGPLCFRSRDPPVPPVPP